LESAVLVIERLSRRRLFHRHWASPLTVSKGCAVMIPDLQQLSTTTRDLRKFGLVVGGVFLLLGGWFLFRHNAVGPYFLMPGVVGRALRFRRAACARGCLHCLDDSGLYCGSACLGSGPHALLV